MKHTPEEMERIRELAAKDPEAGAYRRFSVEADAVALRRVGVRPILSELPEMDPSREAIAKARENRIRYDTLLREVENAEPEATVQRKKDGS